MTFQTKSLEVGRRAANILELDLDRCSRSYGVSPCTADLALQNFVRQSHALATTPWSTLNASITANSTANPIDGTVDADTLVEDSTAAAQHRVAAATTATPLVPSAINTMSGYAFQGSGSRNAVLAFWDGTDILRAIFDLDTQSLVTSSASGNAVVDSAKIHAVPGQQGWFRLTLSGQLDPADDTPVNVNYAPQLADGSNLSYNGDGASSIVYYGMQLRAGRFAGIYAPTTTTAVDGMGTVDDACYNTFGTCQDTANYSNTPQTYRFIERLNLPVDAIDAYPAITNISYGSTRLVPGGGLAVRGKVTVSLQDFITNDEYIDDYRRDRTYDAESQGTFFGKLIARNKFYIGRTMRVKEGYIDEPFDLANFRTRQYIIEDIVGPDKNGKVQIIGKDPLTLAANNKAKCPVPSTGTLSAALGTSGNPVLQTGEGSLYTAGEHIRIDDEIMLVNSISVDTLNVLRAQGGTTAAAHDDDASVQECKTYTDEPVIDIVQDLLENFAGIDSSFIPFTDWEAEETESLTGYNLTTIISEPTGVQKLLKEIVEITLLDIWYSDVDQEIKLKLQTPYTSVTQSLNDDYNVLAKSLRLKADNKQRLTRCLIYYGIINYAKDLTETANYRFANFEIEADKEGANKFNDIKTKVLFTRWMDSSNSVQIALTSQRLLDRFGNMPLEVSFDLDAKDVPTLQTGDVYDLETRIIQGVNGLPVSTRFQVIETKPIKPSSQYRYTSLAFFEDPQTDTLTITTDETDYDVFVELGGPPGPVDVTLTINNGVTVRGNNGPAITTAGLHPDSTISIVNNGTIYGRAGNAGAGGNANIFGEFETECTIWGNVGGGSSGISGGDAISIQIASVEIDNTNGFIFGGGGGGGGGTGWRSSSVITAYGGGGGGGGRGAQGSTAGAGGVATASSFGCGPETTADGAAGTAGTEGAAGTGGLKGGNFAGDGGDGGDWGEAGQAGSSGASGGNGGYAVRLNGASITWLGGNTAAKVKGSVA